MKTLLHIIAALLLVLVTPVAAREAKKEKVATPTPAKIEAKPKTFFQKLFSRSPKPKPVAAVAVASSATAKVAPKPKPRPATPTGVRRGQGQRPDPKNGGATAARSVASAAKKPATPAPVAEATANVLDRAPAAEPIDTSGTQEAYSAKSNLGRAMRAVWQRLSNEAATPTSVEVETIPRVRVTAYDKGDANSAAKRSSTGVPLQPATATQIGVAAGPSELLGSYVVVEKDGGERVYLVADVGGAVESEKASGGTAPVIDLYEPKEPGESIAEWQDWDSYQSVRVVQVRGAAHLLLQEPSLRDDFLDPRIYAEALALAGRS